MLNYIRLQYLAVVISNITATFAKFNVNIPINYNLLFDLHGFHLYQTCNLLKKAIPAFNLFYYFFAIVHKNIGQIYLALAFTYSELQFGRINYVHVTQFYIQYLTLITHIK